MHVYTQQCVLLYLGGWKTVFSYFLGTISLGKEKYTYLSVGISVQWGKYTNLKIQINFNHLFGHIDPSGATHPLLIWVICIWVHMSLKRDSFLKTHKYICSMHRFVQLPTLSICLSICTLKR